MNNLPLILVASINNDWVDALRKNIPQAFFVVTNNGEKALQHTLTHNFNLIIIDSDLNEINGYECTLLLLGAYHSKDIPVIFVAPNNDKTAKWKKFNDETDKILLLNSPCDLSVITNEIRRILNFSSLNHPSENTKDAENPATQSIYHKTILAVDDMNVNLMALEIIFNKLGHKLYTAHNGADAIALCQDHLFDIIFMDCQMPVMDGYQTTKEIKKIYEQKKHAAPIIALTAHAQREDREKCLKAGMHDYLTKPVIKSEITQVLDKWISSIK